jgi:hypothetical protein
LPIFNRHANQPEGSLRRDFQDTELSHVLTLLGTVVFQRVRARPADGGATGPRPLDDEPVRVGDRREGRIELVIIGEVNGVVLRLLGVVVGTDRGAQ